MTTTTVTVKGEAPPAASAAMAWRAARDINLRHFRGDDDIRRAVWALRDAATALLKLLAEREQGAA